jgi:hypothetical protein
LTVDEFVKSLTHKFVMDADLSHPVDKLPELNKILMRLSAADIWMEVERMAGLFM